MAHVAKDGSKHTNMESMKRADAKHAAKAPVEHEEHEGEPGDPDASQESQEIQSPEELQDAFEQHMQEHMAGQPHDPHNTKRLANHFTKKAMEAEGTGPEDHAGAY